MKSSMANPLSIIALFLSDVAINVQSEKIYDWLKGFSDIPAKAGIHKYCYYWMPASAGMAF